MNRLKPVLVTAALLTCVPMALADLPDGYWPREQSQAVLDTALRVHLAPDLSNLTGAEVRALQELLAAGRIMHTLYERQLHRQSATALEKLQALHTQSGRSVETGNLLELFYLFKGPIATTPDNERRAFVPAEGEQAGKNVYPYGLTRPLIEAALVANPSAREDILDLRSVVRRATAEDIAADLRQLDAFPEVDALHPGLRQQLESPGLAGFYAVPYALAYAPQLRDARRHLDAAANLLAAGAPDFAAYLRNRGRDFLSGDYESGDASWVSGDFAGLNIQIGSYETYNDSLLGIKAFYSASILARDEAKTRELEKAIAQLQAIEDSLPYQHHKTVRSRIPVGVYNVVADFGQARGANTATILPNDPDFARKYGRIILVRNNILTNPAINANRKQRFDTVIGAAYRDDLSPEGSFDRTLWHEVGHYLGPSKTEDGHDLGIALGDRANLFEEMKSDLVSLYAGPALLDAGYHDEDGLRAHYADGIRRTLQDVRPREQQAYQNMQLMQFNFFIESGMLGLDDGTGLLTIDYSRYHEVVTDLLQQVLQVQYAGDYEAAGEFVKRWNYWDESLHGRLAELMRNSGSYRRTMVRYGALGR